MRESATKTMWGQAEKLGKGTKVNYDPSQKILTFCFNRGPDKSGEELRKKRVTLMRELEELGYTGCMKYNGEILVENVGEKDVLLIKKNHKLVIRLNPKQVGEEADSSESS